MSRRLLSGIRLLIMGLVLLGPWLPELAAAAREDVVVAISSDATSLDPHAFADRQSYLVAYLIFDTLMTRDPETKRPVAHVAESAEPVGETAWRVRLRKGIRFQNGEPLNAAAVKFSFDRLLSPEMKAPARPLFSWLESVVAVDERTLQLNTRGPYPLVPEMLTSFFVVPPAYVGTVGTEGFGKKPVGSGPFVLSEWERGRQIVLESNRNYWKGSPVVKRAVFRIIPETSTQLAELLAGNVDIVRNLPPDQIGTVERSSTARVESTAILRTDYLWMDSAGRGGPNPLADVKVRQAIAAAINVRELIDQLYQGKALATPTGINPMMFGFNSKLGGFEYDPQRARKLLAEAGFPRGFEITLYSFTGNVKSPEQVAEAIAGYLSQVGIRVKRSHDAVEGTFWKRIAEGKANGLILGSAGFWSIFDADGAFNLFISSKSRLSYVNDPELDQLTEEARSAIEPRKRQELYSALQKKVIERAYWVPLWAQYAIEGVSNRINYRPSPDELIRLAPVTWRARP